MTVVVGPNGSGKSNLVDALSWVLGSQSAKSLRTPKMEDVIFAGTATRPSLGKAEATLIIDNTERQLDLDLDEISITRRLYRDGSSDYELNGVGCRLLDIQDLLSDSGVGRHQHVIIGQGEIGRVLNASPEEHRAVIEEAAGILKHRRRKEKSERRLERTDDDLIRLQDLLGEIGRQMRPLRRQARAAERYEALKGEVVALTLYLAGLELRRLDRDLTVAVSERSSLSERSAVDRVRLAELNEVIDTLTRHLSEIGEELDRDTTAAARLETTIERFRRIASIAHERVRAAEGRQEASVERRSDLVDERHRLTNEIDSMTRDIADAEARSVSAEALFRSLDDEERSIAAQNSMSPEGALAVVRGELSAIDTALERERREHSEVARRIEVLAGQIASENEEIDRINTEIKSLDGVVAGLSDDYATTTKRREVVQERWTQAEDMLASAKVEVAASGARVEAVRAALAGRIDSEGRAKAESSAGFLGTLVARLDIPDGLQLAVAAALGSWEDAVAFADPESVHGAVELVKGSGSGAVSVVASPSGGPQPAKEVAAATGLEALVDMLGTKADTALAARFLGDVVVVEGWASGWSLVSRHPTLRAVTPEGDLITVAGVRLADPENTGLSMLEAAQSSHEVAKTEEARFLSIHTAAKRDFESSRTDERKALEVLEQAETEMAGLSEAMIRLRRSVESLESERSRLSSRIGALDVAMDRKVDQREVLRTRLEALEGEEAERLRVWEELEAKRVQTAADKESARADWQEAAAALRAIVEGNRLHGERLNRVEAELDRLDRGAESAIDPGRLQKVADLARRAGTTIEKRLVELRERQAGLREQNDRLRHDLREAQDEHQKVGAAVSDASRRTGELEVKTVEIRMRREAVMERIRRDAGAEVEEAMNADHPDYPDDIDLESLLEEKSNQLRRLGVINPLAAAEFRDLEERHEFLSAQMEDIEESRRELRKVIAALEEEIEDRFRAAFEEVSAAYQRYFEVLFPGGRGKVTLADENDPHSGVEINAQPLGKKVSQMSLLSGGERSLAALAFLFAIFEARPSPFYVLDEVEAALDDANLRRFLNIVEEFRGRAQLVIITHQQQTMEAADVLYGVTMEPGGSSQAIRKEMSTSALQQSA